MGARRRRRSATGADRCCTSSTAGAGAVRPHSSSANSPCAICGAPLDYQITLEPHDRHWILALDLPAEWPRNAAFRSYDYQLISQRALTDVRPIACARIRATSPAPSCRRRCGGATCSSRRKATRARSRWGANSRRATSDPRDVIREVLRCSATHDFVYTMRPPLLAADSVDEFLFTTRRGFCEHFASAFTVRDARGRHPRARRDRLPGRREQSARRLPRVRQSDAHAGSEVWIDGAGWVRVDPTAAVAPERIERGIAAALAEGGESLPGDYLRQNALFSRLSLAWDAANTFWNNQVVAFGEAQQRWLLDRLNLGDGGQQLGIALVLALIVFFAAMSVYLGWRFRPRTKDPLAGVLRPALPQARAPRAGARAAYEGPSDYLGRVLQARPDLAPLLVGEARNLYVALRYGPRSWGPLLGRSELSRLKFLINQLKV